ncbi:MAG: SH3 domain-containing protein [Weeksellaceae bacterium]|nr:SH3 domain-containing protein [Weeksellaceae bacterium]
MKHFYIFFTVLFILTSCQDSTKEKELELKIRELELRERAIQNRKTPQQEIEKKEEVILPEKLPSKKSVDVLEFGNATIKGTNVIIRTSHSTKSKPKGSFKPNETVVILDEYNPGNSREAITKRKISLYNNSGHQIYSLNPGKAVEVINESYGNYEVIFVHPDYGRLRASINENDLEFITGDAWYKVRRRNGEIGWVFSKFVSR